MHGHENAPADANHPFSHGAIHPFIHPSFHPPILVHLSTYSLHCPVVYCTCTGVPWAYLAQLASHPPTHFISLLNSIPKPGTSSADTPARASRLFSACIACKTPDPTRMHPRSLFPLVQLHLSIGTAWWRTYDMAFCLFCLSACLIVLLSSCLPVFVPATIATYLFV